jgi:hypothetical protein
MKRDRLRKSFQLDHYDQVDAIVTVWSNRHHRRAAQGLGGGHAHGQRPFNVAVEDSEGNTSSAQPISITANFPPLASFTLSVSAQPTTIADQLSFSLSLGRLYPVSLEAQISLFIHPGCSRDADHITFGGPKHPRRRPHGHSLA